MRSLMNKKYLPKKLLSSKRNIKLLLRLRTFKFFPMKSSVFGTKSNRLLDKSSSTNLCSFSIAPSISSVSSLSAKLRI